MTNYQDNQEYEMEIKSQIEEVEDLNEIASLVSTIENDNELRVNNVKMYSDILNEIMVDINTNTKLGMKVIKKKEVHVDQYFEYQLKINNIEVSINELDIRSFEVYDEFHNDNPSIKQAIKNLIKVKLEEIKKESIANELLTLDINKK
jgi:hypothetical protein